MANARLYSELVDTKSELQRLRERVSAGTPTVHRDLSLVAFVLKWSGLENGIPLEEFLTTVEISAGIGFWYETDNLQISALWLTDMARQCYNGYLELHSPGVTWQKFKDALRQISGYSYGTISFYDATNCQAMEKRISPGLCRQVQGTVTECSLQGGRPSGPAHPQRKWCPNAPGQFRSRVNRSSWKFLRQLR
jgi:hypothetical protein